MKLLIIHHDPLSNQTLPQTGGSIRTQHLSEGLQHQLADLELDLDLHWLCKATVEGNWRKHIHQHLLSQQWDVVLCTQMEDACLLPDRTSLDCPIVVDLYAPRLMETMYTEDEGTIARQLLFAIDRADAYLFAHPIQRPHWEALLRLTGVDLRENRLLLCPLGVDGVEESSSTVSKNDTLTFIGGGRVWPWQNPWINLERLLAILDENNAGQVHWFAPPHQEVPLKHPRLQVTHWSSRLQYRKALQQSHIGLDLNPPSIERHYACAFRHMDMIGCGLPILSANSNAMTQSDPDVCSVVDFTDAEALSAQLTFFTEHPPISAIQSVSSEHHPFEIVHALVEFLQDPDVRETKHHEIINALKPVQQADNALATVDELQAKIQALETDNHRQRDLLTQANKHVQSTSASLMQVSKSLEQISAFKNDIAHTWSDVMHQQQLRIQALEDELRTLNADNSKKSAELSAMDQLRSRLENDLHSLRQEMDTLRKSRWRR
jgi:hypothetical protein